MANFKKKNQHRKRSKLHGFRNIKLGKAIGGSWRLNSVLRKFIKASKAVDEE